jgi:hypothetical protein
MKVFIITKNVNVKTLFKCFMKQWRYEEPSGPFLIFYTELVDRKDNKFASEDLNRHLGRNGRTLASNVEVTFKDTGYGVFKQFSVMQVSLSLSTTWLKQMF